MISVIVPVYNAEKYLRECINSLIMQDYYALEIILIDDESQDHSAQIMKEMADTDERIICAYQKNAGVSAARNHGLQIARGEYICFVDADDIVSSDYISYLYELIQCEQADISLVPQAQNFVGNNPMVHKNAGHKKEEKDGIITGEEATRDLLYYRIKMSCWSKMFRRELLEKNNIKFQENLICGEGFNFCAECFMYAGLVAVGHRTIYFYRVDNLQSAMTRFRIELIQSGLEAINRIEELITKKAPNLLDACYYAKWHTNCDFLNMFIGCGISRKIYLEYEEVSYACRHLARYGYGPKVAIKDKVKATAYWISPYIAAKIINRVRIRKFEKVDDAKC